MKNYTKLRKTYAKIIIVLIYITFICYFLGQFQSILDWSFTFHELLFIPYNISFFTLPILCLIWIFLAIRSIKESSTELKDKRKIYFKNTLIIISILLIVMFFNYENHVVQTSGIFTIEEKKFDGEKYNVIFNGMTIKCTWNEYNLIKENQNYLILFNWNEYSPNKGKLEYIELDE